MEAQEFGDVGYAVIDVEALMVGPIVKIVEQVAFVLVSASDGRELLAEKHIVYQHFNAEELAVHYNQSAQTIENAVAIYKRLTQDDPVHSDPAVYPTWSAVRNRIRKILRRRAIKIYAKGAGLERTVFGKSFDIYDLEWSGCPKFPEAVHDPLEECRFFSKYIPEMRHIYFPEDVQK